MIDREARDQLGDLIGRYLQGKADYAALSTGAFNLLGSEDCVIDAIGVSLASDLQAMDDATLRRCQAFLSTSQEYGWPRIIFDASKDYAVFGLLATTLATIGALLVMRRPMGWPAGIFLSGVVATVLIWLSKFVLGRREFEAQKQRHRNEGRDLDLWPFVSRQELPHCVDEVVQATDDTPERHD